jgi:aromatic-L-amino-acid decarboxylase
MKKPENSPVSARPSSLDISAEDLTDLSSHAVGLVSEYFARVSEMPVFPAIAGGEITSRLGSDIPVEPEPLERLIEDCRTIISGSRHNGHPRFFAYVASPSTPAGAFADLIASALNSSVTSWRSGPAATEVERMVVRWLGSLIHYGENTHGLLTSGGSMANLLAILIAQRSRSESNPSREGFWNSQTPMLIYASDQVHMSIPKAADILGIGRNQVCTVETDDRFRMNVTALRQAIERDIRKGVKPFCVVASAGTTNTGAVDRLTEVAEVAEEFGLWFHIDGAYGAPGVLDTTKRPLFIGLERADSISLDPHKWLYTPVDCGCLLFRDAAVVRAAFAANEADYIKVHEQSDEESFAFWDYGLELSRRFRALKVWFTLKYYGARRLAEAISDDNALAQYLAESIKDSEDFELMAPVELSICCFRYVPRGMRDKLAAASSDERVGLDAMLDELNTRIMLSVQRGGSAYLSNATIGGRFALRVCIINFRTTRPDIERTLAIIREAARDESA